jgi:hypothetical protein
MGEDKMMRFRRLLLYAFLAFSFASLSLVIYSSLFRLFIEAYSSARSALHLIWALYLPSLIVISAISVSFIFTICGLTLECNVYSYLRYFFKAYMPILITGGAGAALGLFMGEPTRTAAMLFAINLFIAFIYVILVLYWFGIRLPILLANTVSKNTRRLWAILYWILALALGSWGIFPVRWLALKLFPGLNTYMFYRQLADPLLDEMLRKYLLRYVDAVFFPLFVIISSYIYYLLVRRKH